MALQFAVLGHPVAHSKSPAMQNAAFKAMTLPWTYDFADCPSEDDARELLDCPSWTGLNITMPYKPLALEVAKEASVDARLAGGANVLVRTNDGLWADNTDGRGCVAYLQREGVDFSQAKVVICGSGPTSLAIFHAVTKAGASEVCLAGRDAEKAKSALCGYEAMAEASFESSGLGASDKPSSLEAAVNPTCKLTAGSYETLGEAIAGANVIIDATPLGMKPGDPAPFDTTLLRAGQAIFDVVYGHDETALLAAAKDKGCKTFNGSGMLVAQAVESVYDFCSWIKPIDQSGQLVNPRNFDLFAIMAKAAEFSL